MLCCKLIVVQLLFVVLFCLAPRIIFAQIAGPQEPATDGRLGSGIITTGVPFLLIAPDARSASMGDAGVAISPDVNSIAWNPAKMAYLRDRGAVSVSYTPWLQKLVPDVSLSYLSACHRLDRRNTIGGSIRYFSLGQIQLTDNSGTVYNTYSPSEFALDGAYARSFGENFSLGTAIRFIYSNLSNGQFSFGQTTQAGTALAADVSAYYKHATRILGSGALIAAGLNISNIGNKISYVEGSNKLFLPTNFKLGAAATFYPDERSEFTFTADLNKLLVPTPPLVEMDSQTGEPVVTAGRDPADLSVPAGIFGSFTDAPGGFTEEMQEISYSAGAEYWYDNQFAVRTGYFYESPEKGNRRYFTVGAGLKYRVFNIDFAYLLASQQRSPMANTLRFSLFFTFNK